MANASFITVPEDLTDPTALRTCLTRIIEKLDVAFGNRGSTKFVTSSDIASTGVTPSASYTKSEIESLNDKLNELITLVQP